MRRFAILASVIVFVVAAWTAGWLYAAGQIRQAVAALAGGDDFSLECEEVTLAGFPFRFDVICTGATLRRIDLSVRIPEITATARVYRPAHILAFAQSPIAISDAFFATERALSFDLAEASIRFDGLMPDTLALARLSIHLEAAALDDVLLGKRRLLDFDAAELHVLAGDEAGAEPDDLMVFATAAGLDYPEADLAEARLTATARLTNFPRRLADWTEPDPMRRWAAGGGEAELRELAFTATGIELQATGAARLDGANRPSGTLSVYSLGLVERIDPELFGAFAPVVFGIPDADGTYLTKLSLRGGLVYAGDLPVPLPGLEIGPLF
jgi:hypothetical protein